MENTTQLKKIKLSELLERIDSLTEQEREFHLKNLWEILSPMSKGTLMEFVHRFDGRNRPYEEFCIEQNKVFRTCVDIEMHDMGSIVRKEFKLPPLTLETEV